METLEVIGGVLSFLFMVAIIVLPFVLIAKAKKKRRIKELIFAHADFYIPLRAHLEGKGYTFDETTFEKGIQSSKGYTGRVYVNKSGNIVGTVYFANYPHDLDWLRGSLEKAYIENASYKNWAIDFWSFGVIIKSWQSVDNSHPEVPDLLLDVADWFKANCLPWSQEWDYYKDNRCRKYLNVMFR